MKQLLTLLIILLSATAVKAQKGQTYVLVGAEELIDPQYESIISKGWHDFKDGSKPGMYYLVQYDYGEPPPRSYEIIHLYSTAGLVDTVIRGWKVTFDTALVVNGDDMAYYCVKFNCDNKDARIYRKKYHYQITIDDYDDVFTITIKAVKP